MKNKEKFRRRNYLVKEVLQWNFVGTILLFMALTSVVVVGIVYFTGWSLLKEKLYSYYSDQMLSQVFWEMSVLILFRFLLIVPVVIILAILLSHRIAGPFYKIEKSLNRVAEGDFSLRIRLRKNDELKDLAESINKALEYMENTVTKFKNKTSELDRLLGEIEELVNDRPELPHHVKEKISQLKKAMEEK